MFPVPQKIREYGLQYERSLLEAREQSARMRRQLAAELKGRDVTPLTDDFDDFGGVLSSFTSYALYGSLTSR